MDKNDGGTPLLTLIAVPAAITLGVTLLRLVGELKGWSRLLFNPDAGGGGALIGIVWLVPIFGAYFGIKLERSAQGPEKLGRSVGMAFLSFVVIVLGAVATFVFKMKPVAAIGFFSVVCIAAIWVGLRAWPEAGRVLLAYGLAARIPVAIVMLLAILGNWNTHYDVPPPNFPAVGPWTKWLLIGLLPQMTLWVAFTVTVGTIFAGAAVSVARARRPAHA
jgi:hypothetical protein